MLAATDYQGGLAIDPQSLGGLRRAARGNDEAAARQVAQQFEALLLQQMLSSMRQASPQFSDESASSAVDMFRGMGDQQLAQVWASRGTGLSDAIVRQIRVSQDPSLLKQVLPQRPDPLLNLPAVTEPAAKAAATTATQPASSRAPSNQDEFIRRLRPAAERAAASLGVSPELLIGHAALESGWGRRSIKDAATGQESWNLFGIKAGASWRGRSTDVLTHEFVDGVAQKRVERFRVYDSLEQAFGDYAQLLQRRYSQVQGSGNDARQFARALAAGGYATAPDYASKVEQTALSVLRRSAA